VNTHCRYGTRGKTWSNWGKVLGDIAATSAMLDRLLHHCHVVTCGPRSYRTKAGMKSEDVQA
jgi:DNA replication protein DnaC